MNNGHHIKTRIVAGLALAIGLVATCGAGQIAQAAPPAQDPPPAAPTPVPIPRPAAPIVLPPGTINIALLGIDKRPDKAFENTDVIIIASINPEVPAVTLLSIPRDTPAYVPGVGVRKVNTAWGDGGPDLFKQTIRYNFGIDVSNYALVNFTGVVHAVDTFGGIDVIATCPLLHAFPTDPYYMGDPDIVRTTHTDSFTGEVWQPGTKVPRLVIDIPKPGVYSLDGLHALAFVRARKGVPGGDVDRGRREQRVVRALLAKAKQTGSLNKLTELYSQLKGDVETDMTLETVLKFAAMADKLGDTLIRSRYLVGYDANGAAMEGAPEAGLSRQQYVQQALTVALNQRANEGVAIELLNGTNDAGFMAATADRLKEVGFKITDARPAERIYASTVIIDHTTTKKGSAIPLLLRTFDIKASNVLNDPNPEGPRYSVIAGADFNTCYFARTLEGSGSGKVDVSAQPAQAPVALPSTIEVTSTAITSEPLPSASVAMTVSTLLSNTASSRLAPVLSSDLFTPTMSVPRGDIVNVRSGPGVRFRTLGRLVGGQQAFVLGRSLDGDWINITMPKTTGLGWVKAEVVKVIDSPPPELMAAIEAQTLAQAQKPLQNAPLEPTPSRPDGSNAASRVRAIVPAGDVVNLRAGPGVTYRVVGRMISRQAIAVVGRTNDGRWWQVRTVRGTVAWVSSGIVHTSGDTTSVPVLR